jgi:hypothetical protein
LQLQSTIEKHIMEISFPPDEYRDLIDILAIANWYLNRRNKKHEDASKYNTLIQKIFKAALDTDCADYVEFLAEHKACRTTTLYDDSATIIQSLSQAEEDMFWESLVGRLSVRNTERKLAPQDMQDLNLMQWQEEMNGEIERWEEEFRVYELNRIEIVDSLTMPTTSLNRSKLH